MSGRGTGWIFIGLSAVEAKLRLEMGSERMLAAILEPLRVDYDFILIDTFPSLGTLNINAMAAADEWEKIVKERADSWDKP